MKKKKRTVADVILALTQQKTTKAYARFAKIKGGYYLDVSTICLSKKDVVKTPYGIPNIIAPVEIIYSLPKKPTH